jgi:hypothetical protein
MPEHELDAQLDREIAIAGLEVAARRYTAAFLAISCGDGTQEELQATRERLAEAARTYVAAGGRAPWADAGGPS